jgi:hypothetical protein
MLAAPVMWILGTRRGAVLYGATVSNRGVLLCILALLLLDFIPAGRVWSYDPSLPAGVPQAARDAKIGVKWAAMSTLSLQQVTVTGLPDGWHDARVSLWPAERTGLSVVREPSATAPSRIAANGDTVDFTTLPADQGDWWATISAVGPDGRTYDLFEATHYGNPTGLNSGILPWLLGPK